MNVSHFFANKPMKSHTEEVFEIVIGAIIWLVIFIAEGDER